MLAPPEVCEASVREGLLSQMSELTDIQKNPGTFWQLNNETNLYEEIDMATGVVVRIVGETKYLARQAEFIETEIDGRTVLVQAGVGNVGLPKHFEYSDALGDIICQKIMEGTSFTDIPTIEKMPSLTTIRYWMRSHRDFADKIAFAKRVRAEKMRDEAVRIGKESVDADKNDVPGRALAVATLKWAAEKDDPATYGNKVEVSGGVTVQMILETGIKRRSDYEQAGIPIVNNDDRIIEKKEPSEKKSFDEESEEPEEP